MLINWTQSRAKILELTDKHFTTSITNAFVIIHIWSACHSLMFWVSGAGLGVSLQPSRAAKWWAEGGMNFSTTFDTTFGSWCCFELQEEWDKKFPETRSKITLLEKQKLSQENSMHCGLLLDSAGSNSKTCKCKHKEEIYHTQKTEGVWKSKYKKAKTS